MMLFKFIVFSICNPSLRSSFSPILLLNRQKMRWNLTLFFLDGKTIRDDTDFSLTLSLDNAQWQFGGLIVHNCSIMCHEHYFSDVHKTWKEARAHCREKHAALATVFDTRDLDKLHNSAWLLKLAWIGLYSCTGKDNRCGTGLCQGGSMTRKIGLIMNQMTTPVSTTVGP